MNYTIPNIDGKQMIEVDRRMIENYQISLIQMMEHAGENLARLIQRFTKNLDGNAILLLCGNGHNGGGGLVCARFLINWGYDVCVVTTGNPARRKAITAQHYETLRIMGATLVHFDPIRFPDLLDHSDLVVDAMIGYGLVGDLSPELETILSTLQKRSELTVVSLDTPSGLDVSGGTSKQTVQAKATLTLALPKLGIVLEANRSAVGELFLADIGVPPSLYAEMGLEVPLLFRKSSILSRNETGKYADLEQSN